MRDLSASLVAEHLTLNILYFTLEDFESLVTWRSINTDLLREFEKHGHRVFVVSPSERKKGLPTRVIKEGEAVILKPRIGNIQKTNVIEKGISTLTIGGILARALKKHLKGVRFDLVLYCTPPITFLGTVGFVKKRDNAKTCLLLKDIFPQNAVDIGMMTTTGLKGLLYSYFRKREKKLYAVSDFIDCMSEANRDYILKNNPEVDPEIIYVGGNCSAVEDRRVDTETRKALREKYGIPLDKKVFVYGGNLGKPQGIPFITECLKKCADLEDVFFLIVGDGTEYPVLDEYARNAGQKNLKVMRRLPKEDYDRMVAACDVGLIFLDHRFTIPNFPSRLTSYTQAGIPVIAATDPNTDVGKVIEDGDFGCWCESNDSDRFRQLVAEMCALQDETLKEKGLNGMQYVKEHFNVEKQYELIVKALAQ
ncbi:MAG: glycosyltransferase family 4 protein [Lachnospiraceae bacterium]|nr:glycosyltransferase family 4 protein [Lachnospiraceae bacterium]